MSEQRAGFVSWKKRREGTNKFGAWFLDSFKVADANGNEDPMFYQMPFNEAAAFEKGEYITFSADPRDEKSMTVVKGSGAKPANPPAQVAAPKPPAGGGSTPARGSKKSELFGEIGGYHSEDDIRRMSYSAAQSHGIAIMAMLLENDAFPMSEAQGKAGTAKRFDQIKAGIDKLVVESYFDSATGRKIASVADAGTVEAPQEQALPDPVESVAQPTAAVVPEGPPADVDPVPVAPAIAPVPSGQEAAF